MHGTKSGVEIKGNIEIVLLILILVIAAVGALYYYAQKEPQRANQEMPLVTATPPPSVNKAATPLKTVKPSAQRQETKIALQEKKKPAAESAVPAVKKTNQETPLTTPTPPPSVNKATAPPRAVKLPAQRQETKIALQEKTNSAAVSAVPAVQKTSNGGLASEQKTAEPLQKNTATVAESDKTISGSLYSIRVGSFRSKENVDRLFKKLKENGYQPSLEIVILSDNSTWYRVTAGQFKTQEEATRCAKSLEDKEKIKTMIVKIK
jgi:cell division septation protein DedD